MAELWDYDDVPVVNWGPSNNDNTDQPCSPVEEDEDGNGRLRKRRGGRPPKQQPVPKKRTAAVICFDDDEDDPSIFGSPAELTTTRPANDGSAVQGAFSDSPMQPGMHAATVQVACKSPLLGDAARKVLEQSRQLQQQVLGVQLDEEDGEPDCTYAEEPCSSMHGAKGYHAAGPRGGDVNSDDDVQCMPSGQAQTSGRAAAGGAGAATAAAAAAAAAAACGEQEKVMLICKCRQGSVEIRVRKADPLSKLQKAFLMAAADKGWLSDSSRPPPGMRMEFDGDVVELDSTAADLELEDGYTIDVAWKK